MRHNLEDLHIVTVATKSEYYFPYLVESCKRHGKELEVVGYGEEWKGFNWKFKLIIAYLKNLPSNDIVCFIDGYDVICVRDLYDLKNEFIKIKKQTNCSIIAGHDKIYNNFVSFYLKLTFGKCKNLSLNSGTYIGYVKDLLIVIKEIYNLNPSDSADDQVLMIKYCNLNEKKIFIDVKPKLFLTIPNFLNDIDKYIEINKQNEIIYNNEKPFFIHGPGSAILDNIINKLDYKFCNVKKDLIKKSINNALSLKYLILILFVLFVLFCIYFIIFKKIKKNFKIKR